MKKPKKESVLGSSLKKMATHKGLNTASTMEIKEAFSEEVLFIPFAKNI